METPLWLEIYVVVIGLAVVLQLGVLIALYLGFRDLQVRVQGLLDRDLHPLLTTARSLLESTRKEVDRLAETLEELSEGARTQMGRVDKVMSEATDRTRLQVVRVDQLVADLFNRIERSVEFVEKSLVRPVRELEAFVHGLRVAVDHLIGRRRRTPERATQDEELFI